MRDQCPSLKFRDFIPLYGVKTYTDKIPERHCGGFIDTIQTIYLSIGQALILTPFIIGLEKLLR